MKWYSKLSKKVRTALLVGAWVLAVIVIVVVASIANGATLPWWAALVSPISFILASSNLLFIFYLLWFSVTPPGVSAGNHPAIVRPISTL